jgi:hypothetical protein
MRCEVYPRQEEEACPQGAAGSNEVDATQALNLSAGVSNAIISRGRSLADAPFCREKFASAPIVAAESHDHMQVT